MSERGIRFVNFKAELTVTRINTVGLYPRMATFTLTADITFTVLILMTV